MFEDYIQDHVVSWFTWAQKNNLGVERMEDLILVIGCTLVTSWAAAVVVDNNMEAEISLGGIGRSFVWNKIRGRIEYRNSLLGQVRSPSYAYSPCTDFLLYGKGSTLDQCVFIRGLRAKSVLFGGRRIQAAADPLPDDPDNRREDEIHVTSVPGAPEVSSLLIVG